MALGGICALLRLDARPLSPEEIRGVERMAVNHGWRAAGGTAVAADGPVALATFSPEGRDRSRPSIAVDGPVHAVADARLIARDRLVSEIGLSGPSADLDAASLVLAAYLRWGADCADRLLGDFAFVVWDGSRGRLMAARDPVGARPLHYRRMAGSLWIASDGLPLARGPSSEAPVLDSLFLLDALIVNLRDQARSPFASVRRVLPGHVLMAEPGEVPSFGGRRYWRPERDAAEWSDAGLRSEDDWSAAFQELLDTVVRQHLEGVEEGAALLTSGGLDSSTVAALAQGAYRRGAVAARPTAFIDVFERLVASDESEYARALVEGIGIAAEWIVADDLSDLCPPMNRPQPAESPHSVPGELSEHTLSLARDRGCRLITTGFGGDSLFDAARWQTFDDVRRGRWHRLAPWVAGAVARGVPRHRAVAAFLVPPLLTYRGRRRLDRLRGRSAYWHPPAWLADDLRDEAVSRIEDQGYRRRYRSFARQRQWEHLVGLAQHGPPIEFWTTSAARHGIEPAFPLLDRRVAAFVLAAPLEFLARPGAGGTKWLLRRAMEHTLPEKVRLRPDKASWSAHVRDTLSRRIPDAVRRQFDGGSRLQSLGLVDDQKLREAFETYCSGVDAAGSPAVGGLLGTASKVERWLCEAQFEIGGLYSDPLAQWERDG